MQKIKLLSLLVGIFLAQGKIHAAMMDTVIVRGVLQEKTNDKIVLRHTDGVKESFAANSVQNLDKMNVADEVNAVVRVDEKMYLPRPNLNFKLPLDHSNKTLKQVWMHVVSFMAALDQLPKASNKTTSWMNSRKLQELKKYFNQLINAYAEDRPYTCFYAGWPTRVVTGSSTCDEPWDSPSISRYTACGASGVYRCNPVVFGAGVATTGSSDPAHVVANDNTAAGMCVRASSVRNIVAACVSATLDRIDGHLNSLATTPALMAQLEHFMTSVEQFCRGGGGSVNAVCLHLNSRLATLRFMTGEEERVCRVLQNPSAPTGTCRAIKISCTQAGNSMIGYVRAEQALTFPAANDSRLRGGNVAKVLVNSMGALSRTPCGGDSEETEIGENCVVRANRNLRQEMSGTPVEGCPSGLCSVFAECAPATTDGTPTAFIHNVMLTCDCARVGGGTGVPTLDQLRACRSQQIDQVTVRSPETFGAPASSEGTSR